MTVLILAPERDFTADRMVKALEDRAALVSPDSAKGPPFAMS